jgi:hypothetical protein
VSLEPTLPDSPFPPPVGGAGGDKTADAVAAYMSLGWKIIPIPRGEKGPRIPNWQNTEFAASDFPEGANIGVRLGDPSIGLTDIDLDAPEAVFAARTLLVRSKMVHGRPSKPASHYWFVAVGSKSEVFKDVDGSVLVEIRSTGGQTVLPPSIHPSGELISWDVFSEAPLIAAADLRQSVVLVAVAALLGRHWLPNGPLTNQHASAGYAAGFLLALGVDPLFVPQIIEVAATLGKDSDVADRVAFARSTCAKYAAGDKTAGGPKLAEEIGEKVVEAIRGWFRDGSIKTKLETLNERHAVVFQQSGDLVVITEDVDADGAAFLRFSAFETFRQLYPEVVLVSSKGGKPVYSPLGDAWLKSPKRRFYEGIELAPNGRANPKYYNLWKGFTVSPEKGDWGILQEHIYSVICDRSMDLTEYVIDWMAQAVQDPGHQAETAIALRGKEGTGKGIFVREFGRLFGQHFIHLDSTRHLTGNFNAHLHNAILVFADEATWPGDKAGIGALKRLVTEPTLSIERKGMDIFTVPNLIHLLLASNENWVVPAGMDSRRFAVIDVSDRRVGHYDYFEELTRQMEKGGLAAMLYDLMRRKLATNLRVVPQTEALWEQKVLSMAPQHRWWHQVLADHEEWWSKYPVKRSGKAEGEIFVLNRNDVYQHYVETLKLAGQSRISIATELGMLLKKIIPEPFPLSVRIDADTKGWGVPSLSICRAWFADIFKTPVENIFGSSKDWESEGGHRELGPF